MWIVRLALQRPYTFVVMSFLIFIGGILSIQRMPTDIFPDIDIPVVAVVWTYSGLDTPDMAERVTFNFERMLPTTVNRIEHMESQTLNGLAVVKIFFEEGTNIGSATAQVTAISQNVLRQLPPGITPPLIVQYSAADVPVIQGSIHSDTLTEAQLFDLTSNFVRTGLATVPGSQVPIPYGGLVRRVMVDIDPMRLYSLGLSPNDINQALLSQNVIFPSGTIKFGDHEVTARLNSSPETIEELSSLPIKTSRGGTVLMSDVAQVRDGYIPQASLVRNSGRHGTLMTVLKANGASTLDVIRHVREALPGILKTVPEAFKLDLLFDQAIFVRAAVEGVLKEASIAAGLTALMILLFLGSWRSTIIVVVSIPLSILVSIIILGALGHSLNLMTLGGLSLAVGILVDDATVGIENIHRNIAMRKPLVRAILDGSQQIAMPALVATLCICIVFIPVVFIAGAARFLFFPMAMAVVFAMLTSYLLSRTLVPTMVNYMLGAELHRYRGESREKKEDIAWRAHQVFNVQFERLRRVYGGYLDVALSHKKIVIGAFLTFAVASCVALFPFLGRDFFPSVDAGQIRLHVRCQPGTRIEASERIFTAIENTIRDIIPASELDTVLDNIGVPFSGINLALGDSSMISPSDGEIDIALTEDHAPTINYIKEMRERLNREYPEVEFFFLPADITTQVLNFGLSAPIDVQVVGPIQNEAENIKIARKVREEMKQIHGAVDVHLHQVTNAPDLFINVDRVEANEQDLTTQDVASDVLVSLSSSAMVNPNYWVDPKEGVQFFATVQTPQRDMNSMDKLLSTPIASASKVNPKSSKTQYLGNLATVKRDELPVNITHYNIAKAFDILANVQDADLDSVGKAVEKLVERTRATLPRGSTIVMRGQVDTMNASFRGLAFGIIFAIVLVYFLMVVNFQSWLDPFIILTALPGAIAGICWMLFSTKTHLSVPALMGAIMCIGVATSNSILMVTFANDQRADNIDARRAAWLAGITRLRPVIMTALAMVLGMLPMSLGLGEGGEQNAPLGRAVIGGLLLATVATLFFVPVIYSVLRSDPPRAGLSDEEVRDAV